MNLKICIFALIAATAFAQVSGSTQTETDEYTRYELLAPDTASFAIHYEVTASTPGANVYYNPIRKGSVARDESVTDVMTGQPLKFEVVNGEEVVKDPLMKGEDTSVDYIKVHLARPVPPEGQARLLILKTYKDAKSYYREGDAIVFNRPLSIPRNSVVLPAGYELVSCNVPSQVLAQPDGRIAISFMNGSGAEAPLILKAKPGAEVSARTSPRAPNVQRSAGFLGLPEAWRLAERAHDDRENVYTLQTPEAHTFRFQSDFTWEAETDGFGFGIHASAKVTELSAVVLDTGDSLATKVIKGGALAAAYTWQQTTHRPIRTIVISSPTMEKRQSVRVRLLRTEIDAAIFHLDGRELVFDERLDGPRNAVVLPDGWYLTASSIPATVSQLPDGRIRLDFWNGRPDSVDVLIKAKRRAH